MTVAFRKMNGGGHLLLSLVGVSLFVFADCLSSSAQESSVIRYPASQINCGNLPGNIPGARVVVETSSGLQTVTQYCGVQAPIQDRQRRDAILWGSSYRQGNFICRDRLNVDIVCVTPSAAERLRWNIPPQ